MGNKIALDLDDVSFQNNNFWYVDKLREQYPGFKLSAFFIPYDMDYFKRLNDAQLVEAKALMRIGVAEGWLELIPHGLVHSFGEFRKADYDAMQFSINAYEEYFKELDVPYVKGFKAPQWLISDEAIRCLDDNGWWLAVDRNQPDSKRTKKYYQYNWSIDEPFKKLDIVKAHGHISLPSSNNLPDCIINLSNIPQSYEWVFASTLLDEQN